MDFSVFYGLAPCLFLLAHVGLWRRAVPRRQSLALLGLTMAALVAGLCGNALFFEAKQFIGADFVLFAVFHVTFCLSYIIFYSAVADQSPSLAIASFLFSVRPLGATREEIIALFQDAAVLEPRIASMAREGYVDFDGEVVSLTPKGKRFAVVILGIQRLLNLPEGG